MNKLSPKSQWRTFLLLGLTLVAGLFLWFSGPTAVEAASGLVPCGGPGQMPCQMCHVVDLTKNVSDWIVRIATLLVILFFVVSGLYLVSSVGAVSAKTTARRYIVQATVGYVIILSIWGVIDVVLRVVLVADGYAMWSTSIIACVDQPMLRVYHPTPDASRGTATNTAALLTAGGAISPADVAALAGLASPDEKVLAAAAAAGLSSVEARNLQALMRVESGGCRNLRSPVGALGCMQIMPNTARQYDPSLRGLTDAEVENRLLQEDYNIQLGARIYADLHRGFGGDATRVHAGYNGGPGANLPSRDCPGAMRWQCPYDSAGCWDARTQQPNGATSCTPNVGYRETRAYVLKVKAVADALP